ncbi:polysaccharide deacetylase family protein [Henriciella sp.]|uniref:polysaccharide deacetylase family protein n=1 Tax=Henriciella sp. TaxID=1968823 RepID=UPI00262941E0|nr:polysaccharide deacetylase family protein [Henriciella sp.]
MADLGNFLQNPVEKIRKSLPRFLAKDISPLPEGRYVSICFDDFPKSAAIRAKHELDRRDWKATWYAVGSQMGTEHPGFGPMYDAEDLQALVRDGHEVGCHTYSHIDCRQVDNGAILEDVQENIAFFANQGLPPARSFAFPFGSVDVSSKRLLMSHMPVLRGVRPGLHQGMVDRGLLMATGIEDYNGGTRLALQQLEQLKRESGWLVIFTHDVREQPGPWGCSPEDFVSLLDAVDEAGAEVVTVADMFDRIAGKQAASSIR